MPSNSLLMSVAQAQNVHKTKFELFNVCTYGTQNITNAALFVVLSSMLTNIVELIELLHLYSYR